MPDQPKHNTGPTTTKASSSNGRSQLRNCKHRPTFFHLFAFMTWVDCVPLTIGLVASILAGALKTSLAIILGEIFTVLSNFGADRLSGPDAITQISRWCLVLLVVGALGWLVNFVFLFTWEVFCELQVRTIRHRIFGGLIRKDMQWFDCQPNGIPSLLVRTQTQTRELQAAICVGLGNLSTDIATSVANLIVAFYFSWKIALVVLATVPISIILLAIPSRNLKPAIQSQQKELGLASKHTISAIVAIDLVKVFNGVDQEIWQYAAAIKRSMHAYLTQSRAIAYQMGYVKFWMESLFVIGFYYGAVLVNQGTSAGNVMTTFYAALGALQAIETFLPMYLISAKGMAANQVLRSIADDDTKGLNTNRILGRLEPDRCLGEVKVRDISFAYPSNPTTIVLNHASFLFPAGSLCFIVGPSGSGKSTLSNMLLKFYEPLTGEILIDGHQLDTLDTEWVRNNITLIQQSSTVFNETLYMNVAFGRNDSEQVTRVQLKSACDFALLQSVVASLPHGVDTQIGCGGQNLSGGQIQRLSLARAKLRDTHILILDEVTSGQDPISRNLILDAIRKWRRGKTTIIITHEVAQIKNDDFVYVMDQGFVVQKGLREHLIRHRDGMFAQLAAVDNDEKLVGSSQIGRPGEDRLEKLACSKNTETAEELYPLSTVEGSLLSPLVSAYLWPHDVGSSVMQKHQMDASSFLSTPRLRGARSTMWRIIRDVTGSDDKSDRLNRRLAFRASSSQEAWPVTAELKSCIKHDISVHEMDRGTDIDPGAGFSYSGPASEEGKPNDKNKNNITLRKIYATVWPNINAKERLLLVVGLLSCILVAASIPAFSVIFANLLAGLYSSEDGMATGHKWALLLLLVAFVGSLVTFLAHYLLEYVGQAWVNSLRTQAISRLLRQTRPFFDKPKHAPGPINECMDRKAEEMRNLVGRFAPMLLVIGIMTSTSIIWAMVISWRLTLVALASGLLLTAAAKGYSSITYKWEMRYNKAAEKSFAVLNETFTNIRVVRALTLERFFCSKHDRSVSRTFSLGLKKAIWEAVLFACCQTMFWLVLALIFYYATVITAVKKEITVDEMLKVINLLILGLSTASNMLSSIPTIGAAKATATQLLYYAHLPILSEEESSGQGRMVSEANTRKPPIKKGEKKKKIISLFPVRMDGLAFSYPTEDLKILRTVLHNISLEITPRTATAIVGPSGCGKSTLALLLLTLHVPDFVPAVRNIRPSMYRHPISFAGLPPSLLNLPSLRSHLSYVPQTPFLFPSSVASNITYGLPESSPLLTRENIRKAAREAGILDFVASLPEGFDTLVGDGGQCLSSGQAQRVCLARALVRRPGLLVLDEPTSALDPKSAEGVRNTIQELMKRVRGVAIESHVKGRFESDWERRNIAEDNLRGGRGVSDVAVVVITHRKEMMRIADRIVMMDQGRIVEIGSYDGLIAKQGRFAAFIGAPVDRQEGEHEEGRRKKEGVK